MKVFHAGEWHASGAEQMALDEALLEWIRAVAEPSLIVRTYTWTVPTLSLGVHQPAKDYPALARAYQHLAEAIVRRPTGGRAILHGKDVSFAFITNDPGLLHQNLSDSYAFFTKFVQTALMQSGIPVTETAEAEGIDYLRSPACFNTHTPSDLKDIQGRKICGSAQLRRQNGILQHGAAFLTDYGLSQAPFTQALFRAVAAYYDQADLVAFPIELIDTHWQQLTEDYIRESADIWASFSTSMGSHLEPASC
jgi:lipoate---protein ligase